MKKNTLFIFNAIILAISAVIFVTSRNGTEKEIVAEKIPLDDMYTPTYYTGVNITEPIYFKMGNNVRSIPFGSNTVTQAPTTNTQPEEKPVEDTREKFNFDSTLFIGDSIFVGLETYIKDTNNETMSPSVFFANGGFAIRHNRQTVNNQSTHPKLNGEKMKISKAVRTTDKDNLFIMMGTNDLVVNTPSTAKGDFSTLMTAILDSNPGMKVHILETVVPVSGKSNEKLTCDTAKEYNKLLKSYAEDKNYKYIELPDALFDENGCLKAEYSSDGFLHLNEKAYKLIVDKLMYIE